MRKEIGFKRTLITSTILAALGLSSAAMADVTFTEIPYDAWGGTVAVSNDGVVAFPGDTTLYKWSSEGGLTVLGDAGWARTAVTHIANDGNVVAFVNVALDAPELGALQSGATIVYTGDAERIVLRNELNVSTLSESGTTLGGGVNTSGYHQAATLDLLDNSITTIADLPDAELLHVLDISTSGDTKLFSAHGLGNNYIASGNEEPQLIEGLFMINGMSGNGQTVTSTLR